MLIYTGCISSAGLIYYYYKTRQQKNKDKNKVDNMDEFLPSGIEFFKMNPGLTNFGTTCFANSILQGLSSCTYFIEYLLQNKFNYIIPNELIVFNELLLNLLLSLNKKQDDQVSEKLVDFIQFLEERENFDFDQQQDSHEFLQIVSKNFHKLEDYKQKMDESLAFINYSNLDQVKTFPFSGKIGFYLQCKTCNQKGLSKVQEFYDLSLELGQNHQIFSLEQLLQNRFKQEYLNDVYCSKCSIISFKRNLNENQVELFNKFLQSYSSTDLLDIDYLQKVIQQFCNQINLQPYFRKAKRNMIKKEYIRCYPQILTLFINRVTYDNYGRCSKNQSLVKFPLQLNIDNQKYNLKSFVSHSGNQDYGHYICVNKSWTPIADIEHLMHIQTLEPKLKPLNWCFNSDKCNLKRNMLFEG